jgi:hypothetical protein
MVDLISLYQAYKYQEITEIMWINRGSNLADAITVGIYVNSPIRTSGIGLL